MSEHGMTEPNVGTDDKNADHSVGTDDGAKTVLKIENDESTDRDRLFHFQKKDLVMVALVAAVALLACGMHLVFGSAEAACVTVKVAGKIEGVYSLDEDQTIEINGGTNILVIRDGKADVTEADCPDKLCVNQKEISENGESIICLPNRVVVSVDSRENSTLDAVAQ